MLPMVRRLRARFYVPSNLPRAAIDLAVRNPSVSASVEFIDENGGGPGRATAKTPAAKAVQIVGQHHLIIRKLRQLDC
jgi:hypothetical protein